MFCRATRFALLTAVPLLAGAAPAHAAVDTLSFAAEADTYVDASLPASAFGTASGMWVDASPVKRSFVRFRVGGIAGRAVLSARLRLTQRDASSSGGRVFAMTSGSWSEAMTWETQPPVDGPQLASFGAVANGSAHEVELGPSAVRDGVVSLAIDSTSSDSARWGTRESSTPPRLTVDVESPPGFVLDGLSQVADGAFGSSEPTYFSGNRHLATTAGGRLLAVYGRHASGVQLAWRDPGGAWRTETAGALADGGVLTGTGTGDWPTSIAVGRDSAGAEHAWIVASGRDSGSLRPLQLRRLGDLDAPGGPTVGPLVTLDSPPGGAFRADVAVETAPGGTSTVFVVWSRSLGTGGYELAVAPLSDLDSDAPALLIRKTLLSGTSNARFGSLVPAPAGMRVLARGSSSVLTLFGHAAGSRADAWSKFGSGPYISSSAAPTGVALSDGRILAAVEEDVSAHVSRVYRFPAGGGTPVRDLDLRGYGQPSIATDGAGAWLVAVRQADRRIVSRARAAGGGWTSSDRLEIGAEAAGPFAWPNLARAVDDRLRFVVEGPGASSSRSSVMAFQRLR
jgi:hypothetical protein